MYVTGLSPCGGGSTSIRGLYVYGDFCLGRIYGAAVSPSGRTARTRRIAGLPRIDNLSSFGEDTQGRVYVVSLGGVHVFSAKGDLLGTIPLSLQGQNIAFAGADKKTLYIVGRGAAFKVRLLAAGFAGRAK